MDISPDIIAFQGAITSIGNTISLCRITTKGGNEENINNIIEELSTILIELRYISNESPVIEKRNNLRKFALYLILNSDLPALQQMTNIDGIESLIYTTPVISKCLMCEMLWSLHTEEFVYEMITYLWPSLAVEVAESFINSIKYFSPTECIPKIELLALSCYKQICRTHHFRLTDHEKQNIFKAALVNFQLCLNYFTNPPNSHKLNSLSGDNLYKYTGDNFYAMLQLISKCIEHHTMTQDYNSADNIDIYECTYKNGSYIQQSVNFSESITLSPELKESINKCFILLLDKCRELVMNVSVEIFCAWSEFEENGHSMQQKIGESCHNVSTKLSNISEVSKHSLISMLHPLSRKPESVDEIVDKNNFEDIIEKIENSSQDKATWLRALLAKDNICDNIDVLLYLEKHLNLLNEDDYITYYKILKLYRDHPRSGNRDHLSAVIAISIKVFHCCRINDRLAITREHFGSKCFRDILMVPEYKNMSIQIFNKLRNSENFDVSDVLDIFIQNPGNVFSNIFSTASENAHQTDIMLKVMNLLSEFSEHYYDSDVEPCLIKITKQALEQTFDSESKKVNVINFVKGLKTNNIIPGSKILLLVIMPILHKVLLNKDIPGMNIQVRLLSAAYSVEELVDFRAPMLVMISQVMHLVRWTINTFTPLAPATLQVTLDLQKSLFDSYGTVIPDRDSRWLKNRLKNVEPLNQYYFRKLWDPPGSNFVEIISGSQINSNMNIDSLLTWLSTVVVQCSQEEWCLIWESLLTLGDVKALDAIDASVRVLTAVETSSPSSASWACLLHCYNCYSSLIRYNFIKEPIDDSQVKLIANKLVAVINLTSEDRVHVVLRLFTPLFAYLAEKRGNYTFNVCQYLQSSLRFTDNASFLNPLFSEDIN